MITHAIETWRDGDAKPKKNVSRSTKTCHESTVLPSVCLYGCVHGFYKCVWGRRLRYVLKYVWKQSEAKRDWVDYIQTCGLKGKTHNTVSRKKKMQGMLRSEGHADWGFKNWAVCSVCVCVCVFSHLWLASKRCSSSFLARPETPRTWRAQLNARPG